ncbi:class IV adenylate cyclase [Haloglomus halophilum]|uniref:class IV adenylate cyclase n=1 Tax=Haloglomus halophilum TaxID=2962672 RepID=UPI0020C974D5|nr:class IV adenylate cyclase [Haloglomus halophilum]
MYEVELKVRADHDRVRERLAEVEATDAGGVTQVDTYYDAPHRDFASTDEALRLRRETPTDTVDEDTDTRADGATVTKLTYKGPLVEAESKTRREHETEVLDDDEAMAILSGLGFEPAATVEKHRRFFRYEGYTVTLDRVDGLGEFVEVETEAEAVEAAREGAIAVMAELGLDPDEQIRTSYLGLLLADG